MIFSRCRYPDKWCFRQILAESPLANGRLQKVWTAILCGRQFFTKCYCPFLSPSQQLHHHDYHHHHHHHHNHNHPHKHHHQSIPIIIMTYHVCLSQHSLDVVTNYCSTANANINSQMQITFLDGAFVCPKNMCKGYFSKRLS